MAEAIKHLPGASGQSTLINEIRDTAASLHQDYAGFSSLRNKIHGRLGASDADLVREFAKHNPSLARHAEITALADAIDSLFDAKNLAETLTRIAAVSPTLKSQVANVNTASSSIDKFVALGSLSAALRKEVQRTPRGRTSRLNLGAGLEQSVFTLGRELINQKVLSRRETLRFT